ncbi:hypothetical protein [Roseomonas sp. HF4]|uniref:hypothetical protein n=1 Tax=Roseomonas sp. HF4 TaxID=2562313 RepID=UPI0010C082F4|nr:hypothetical protein [Roseomonas sp. HF4]
MPISLANWAAPVTLQQMTTFLQTEPAIQKLNFEFAGIRIWPEAYSKHLVNALSRGDIQCVGTNFIEDGASGSYSPELDIFKMRYSFNLKKVGDQALTIHELTHAFLDLTAQTGVTRKTSEAISYLAQATFLEINGYDPLGNVKDILNVALPIAQFTVIPGNYSVRAADVAALEAAVAANPLYAGRASEIFLANGFTRGRLASLQRLVAGSPAR